MKTDTLRTAGLEKRRLATAMVRAAMHFRDSPIPESRGELLTAIDEFDAAAKAYYNEMALADDRRRG